MHNRSLLIICFNMCACVNPNLPIHPPRPFPWYPQVCPLSLWACFCSVNKFTGIISLDSICISYDICSFSDLLHFHDNSAWPIHAAAMILFHCVLWLRNIPLYTRTYLLYPSLYWWTLGYFHIQLLLPVLQWTLRCMYLFQIMVFSTHMPRSAGIAWSNGSLIFAFKKLFSIVAVPILHSHQQVRGSLFSIPSSIHCL